MSTPAIQPLWGIQDVAAYLGVPVETIYGWRKKGIAPPGGRFGKHLRFDPEEVQAWAKPKLTS